MGEAVGKQSVRQAARRLALDAQAKMRAERVEREKRLSALGVAVMVALGERDGLVTACEKRAGEALRKMTEDEGLSLREAVGWCGADLPRREAMRLRRLIEPGDDHQAVDDQGDDDQTTAAHPVVVAASRGAAAAAGQ